METERSTDDLVRELLAREQLRDLKARYFRCLDRRDLEGFGSVFAVDAVLEVPEVDLVLRGRDQIAETVLGSVAGAVTVHHGHTPEITVTGPTTATGTWAMADVVEWPRDQDGKRVGISGAGHYEEQYVVEDGEWRIAHSRLVRLRVDDLAGL